MVRDYHIIGRLDVEAVVPDLDMALALRPRVEALCWRLMPEVLDRVCDALLPADMHLKLGRVEFDLGMVRPNHLEEDTLLALEAAFSEMLSGALLSARRAPSEQARLLSAPEAALSRLESYLVSGAMALAGRATPFDPLAALLEAAEAQPEALIAMLRRRAHDPHVLQRLVRQLGEQGLARLLSILAPADAAIILGLLEDVLTVHRRAKPPELERINEPALRELVWIATLEFLLRDPGSQFNRRRFLRFLLEREARGAGIAYESLLGLLASAAEKAAQRSLLTSSLPRTLAELLAESARPPPPSAAQPPGEDGIEALIVLARRHAGDLSRLYALFAFTARATLDALVRRLEPGAAAAILKDFVELEALQAVLRLVPPTGEAFRRLMSLAALGYLAAPHRTAYRRRLFWRSMVVGLSRLVGQPPAVLAGALRRGLRDFGGRYPRLEALMRDLAGFALPPAPVTFAADTIEEMAGLICADVLAGPVLDRLLEGADQAVLRRLIERLTPAFADIFAVIARLMQGRSDHSALRLERRSLMVAVAHLAEQGDQPFDLRAWSRRLLYDLRDAEISAEEAAIDSFLRTGRPRRGGAGLPDLLARDPEGLAERLMRFARQEPERIPALAGRLLDWLTPRDLLALLAPAPAPVPVRQTLVPGGERAALLPVVEALLRGQFPDGGTEGRAAVDRYGLAAHWLAYGRVPAWAPAGIGPRELAAGLAELDIVLLTSLLPDEPADRAADRARLLAWLEGGGDKDDGETSHRFVSLVGRRDPVLLSYLSANRSRTDLPDRLLALLARVGAPAALATILEVGMPLASVAPSREDAVPDADGAAFFAWLSGSGRGDDAEMVRRFLLLADQGDPALRDYVAAHRSRQGARRRWAVLLPPEGLARLVGILTPPGTQGLVEGVMLIGAAWRQLAPFGARRFAPAEVWSNLLDRIATPGPVDLGRVLTALMDDLTGGDEAGRAKLTGRVRRLARDGGHVSVRLALRPPPRSAPQRAAAGKTDKPAAPPTRWRLPAEPDHPIYVANAGLVLFSPFLPTLFQRLGLWPGADPERSRRDGVEDASRAVHLLHYLADGRLDAPEVELVLNKVMCGKPTAFPVDRALTPLPADLDLCDDLMKAMLSNWPPLRQSSVAALRETFLQREGRLRHADGKWLLQVQRKTVDVLVDQIPWGFGTLYHGWMLEPLHVTW